MRRSVLLTMTWAALAIWVVAAGFRRHGHHGQSSGRYRHHQHQRHDRMARPIPPDPVNLFGTIPFSPAARPNCWNTRCKPGTYGFRVIDPADALAMFPALTPGQTNQMFTAWTYNSPWATDYVVFDQSATNNTTPQLFDGAFSNTNGIWYTYSNATNAYNAAVAGGFYNLIRSGINGRNGTNGQSGTVISTSYAFNSAATLIFAVPDYDLADNNGGVSVLISPTTAIALPPVLSIFGGTGTVTLRWPTNAVGFNLTQTTNLLPAAWNYVTNVPTVVATNFSVTLPVGFTNRFFRLQNP
jgi:hypothetical protein